MSNISMSDTLGQLVAERPNRSKVLEHWGLDYCCGGKKTLEAACADKRIDLDVLLHDLNENDTDPSEPDADWRNMPLVELADHITDTHHAYLREALPRLTFLTEKVHHAHGSRHPELLDLAVTFTAFRFELENHMVKEDEVLFPLIKRLETATTLPPFHCGSVNNPIGVMEMEHNDAGEALATMRSLTDGFTPPSDACNTYRALMDALTELEADMHLHVHKENSVLFPRASAAEAKLIAV